jgi:hypothetical protein
MRSLNLAGAHRDKVLHHALKLLEKWVGVVGVSNEGGLGFESAVDRSRLVNLCFHFHFHVRFHIQDH